MNLLDIAIAKKMGGGGGSEPTIEVLSVTENGTYTAPSGVDGYNPITVNVSGGGGGGGITADEIAMKKISGVVSGSASYIASSAFYSCNYITAASFPAASYIGGNAFAFCGDLTTAIFPSVTSIQGSAFSGCHALTTVSFPNLTRIAGSVFMNCTALETVSFPKVSSIGASAFMSCSKLTSVYMLETSVAKLSINAFSNTPMVNSTYTGAFGSIYVPASLVDSYKSAAYWSAYADRITAYEG